MKLNFKTTRQIWDYLNKLGHEVQDTFCGIEVRTLNNVYYIKGTLEEMSKEVISLVARGRI